jgi:stage IV sporulation protein FB
MGGFRLFSLAGIPVWVSPWFLLIPFLLVQRMGVERGLVLSACVLVSIVAHELGHALVARRYKLAPQIMVHAFGGYTGHQRARTSGEDAKVIAAGPAAGFLLALASAVFLFAQLPAGERNLRTLVAVALGGMQLQSAPLAMQVAGVLVFLNVVWSLFNSLPVYPMDGGRLLRLGLLKVIGKPLPAERITHVIGLAGALGLAYLAYRHDMAGVFTLVILGMMALRNVQGLTTAAPTEPVRRDNPFARELLVQAERAYQQADYEEAGRLCHQIRAESSVPPAVLARTWAMLGVIATRKGEFGEALSYLRRAPDAADVVEATAQCFYQLEMYDALRALTETKAFSRLPTETREQILGALQQAMASPA